MCYNIASTFLFFGLRPQGMWDLPSPARDQTYMPCIGRCRLNHWTSREIPPLRKLQGGLGAFT